MREATPVVVGKVFATRFGQCTLDPSATEDLEKNARQFSERYAVEAGFRRCSSRLGVPNPRASWFECDVLQNMAPPGRFSFSAFSHLRVSRYQRAKPHHFAARAPSSQSLRCSSGDGGFAYQFVSQASALVMLLTSGLVTPTVSYRNRVMATEVITRAHEVCEQKMVGGYVDRPYVDRRVRQGRGRLIPPWTALRA